MRNSLVFESLASHFDALPIVDTHEHLPMEKYRLASPLDFSTLFSHYCRDDLETAGMSEEERDSFYAPSTDVERKWRIFAKYYPYVKNTSYIRAAKLSMLKFYEVAELNGSDAQRKPARHLRQGAAGGVPPENQPDLHILQRRGV